MSETPPPPQPAAGRGDVALVLSGGGARSAYQVGMLRHLARRFPDLSFPIITGVSAGAINASLLAAHPGSLADAAETLTELWANLEAEDVFHARGSLLGRVARWGVRLVSGGSRFGPQLRSMVDTSPLDRLLRGALQVNDEGEILGVQRNLERGRLKAAAVTTLNFATGQTVTWVQGRQIEGWERSNRKSAACRLNVSHVMASAALPLFFPAVRIGRDWHGDGGIRLAAPLSPALHLGARRILAVSTRYRRTAAEEERPEIAGYPPPAQILGHLMKAVFLDMLDEDVARMERFNDLLCELPPDQRGGMQPTEILALRPSVDLGTLARDYEPKLPGMFRFLTRSLGTRETKSPDFISLLMFQPDYLRRLIEIGEKDAEARADELAELLSGEEIC
ncbi:MAG TPA: patatin-like phospholipase family protein [Thermoanaerobaculia bacterium]|nr:patatin-like phospholipase family protein [Thermoanaerobaculia bacterium]